MKFMFLMGCAIAVTPSLFLHRFDGMSILGLLFMGVAAVALIARQPR
jgi:hypothetical protein